MKRFLQSDKGILILYSIISLCFIFLSLLGLIWNVEEAAVVLSISVAFNFLTLLIMLKTNLKDKNDQIKASKVMMFSLLRFLTVTLGLVLSILYLYLTMSDVDTKYRLLYSLFSLIPLFSTMVLFYLKEVK